MLYIQTDFTSRFKHMYHTIMTTMVPKYTWFRLHPLNFCNIVAILKESNFPESLRGRPFNLKGGDYGFLFCSEFFFRTTTRVRIFFFVVRSANFFPQNLTFGYMTKTLNQIIFFPLH